MYWIHLSRLFVKLIQMNKLCIEFKGIVVAVKTKMLQKDNGNG